MISINFVGDVALFKVFEDLGVDPFKEITLPKSDYNIGNFEFIIPNNRLKHFFDVSDEYAVGYKYFNQLDLNKFNAFSLANNHIMDYGVGGCKDVLSVFEEKKIKTFGFGNKKFNLLTFNIKEISFAVIAFVKQGRWSRNIERPIGPDSYELDNIILEIKRLKKLYNHVIIFPHWGTELVDVPDPNDVKKARAFIDNGASAVIGHHPHIIQGIEKYKKGVIAYSLGSFIYVPEKEVGYSKSQGEKRNYSICLNLKFDKNEIKDFQPTFYKYCNIKHLPQKTDYLKLEQYFKEINKEIDERGIFVKKLRQQLIAREIKSFFERFKKTPIKTIIHYFNYLKMDHLKKLIK